jgi:ribosomal protein L19
MTDTQKYPIPTAAREDLEEALGLVWQQREDGVTDAATLRRLMNGGVERGRVHL